MAATLLAIVTVAAIPNGAAAETEQSGQDPGAENTAQHGYDRRARSAPRVQIQQDGPMVEVVLRGRNRGVDRLAYRLESRDTDALVEGETDPPQIKLVLALGETYDLTVRSHHRRRGWSEWTKPVELTGGAIDAYPFAIQAEGVDGGIDLRWADTGADGYRVEVRTRRGHRVARQDTSSTAVTIDGLRNGRTYHVTIRSRYGDRLTTRSPALPITPNDGKAVTVELRDYATDPLTGPTPLTVRTAVTGATERVDRIRVRVVPEGLWGRTRTATFDAGATATTGIDGAWVTPTLSISPFDHELVTLAKGRTATGKRGVLASSMQTWLLGNVDAFAPGADVFTRVGTHR